MTSTTPEASSPPTFDALPLSLEVRRAIDEMGWSTPTPVQLATFEPAAEGRDLAVQARTGTGKTAAFGLPLVDRRVRLDGGTQVLILAPTRELALQSAREIERIGAHKGIKTTAVYGGAPMERQIREIEAGAHIVSGTPGRVLDHLMRGTLRGEAFHTLVLDEADEMLSMGFARELNAIVEQLPRSRQTMLFSATLDDSVQSMAQRVLRDPVSLALSSDQVGALTISHFVYMISGLGKTRDLARVLEVEDPESAIIFCNTKAVTEQVAAELMALGFQADWLNGDLPQNDRERVLSRTRKGELRYLVATDVAARGIDISHLTHVVNYDFPIELEQYVHRTGRTGRAGRTGTAISLITPQDLGSLYYLRLQYKIFPLERSLPSAGEVRARAEMDRLEMLAAAFPGSPSELDRSVARRLITHDDAERLVAGLLGAFFGTLATQGDVDEQASAARRARPAAPVVEAVTEAEPARRPRREDRPREDRPREDRPRREERREVRAEERRADEPPRREPRPEDRRDADEGGMRRRRRREREEQRPVDGLADAEAGATEPGAPAPVMETALRVEGTDTSPDILTPSPRVEEHDEDPGMSTLFVNVGRRDGVRVGDIIRMFDDLTGLGKDALGRIRIRDRHTFVGVPRAEVERVLSALVGRRAFDKELVVEISRAEQRGPAPAEPPKETAEPS